jgi:sugar phosphate isomerase/epimerase
MNRREFVRLGALGIAVSAFGDVFDYPWKLGIITDEVSPDLQEVLKTFYPKYGLKWAEIRNLKLDGKSQYVYKTASPAQLKEIRQQLNGAGVAISILDTGVYKIALPGTSPLGANASDLNQVQGDYDKQLDELKQAAEAAHTLGTNRVRIFTFKRVANPDAIFDRILDNLHKAIDVAKAQDVKLIVENEFDCNTGTGAETAKLFKAISDRTLMHNWDPGNCFEAGEEPFPKAWDQLDKSRISHIHLKDAVGKNWAPIGGGKIDFVGQFKALKQMNYAGTMSLETHYSNAQHDPYTSSVESMDGLVGVLKQV